jgi:hypothetical protein
VRWLDARSLLVSCKTCTHETVLNIDALPDTVPLSWFAESFVCKHCETVDAYSAKLVVETVRRRSMTSESQRWLVLLGISVAAFLISGVWQGL